MNRLSFFKTLLGIGIAKTAKSAKSNEAVIALDSLATRISGNDLIVRLERSKKLSKVFKYDVS